MKQTPLDQRHRQDGGRMVEFGGWEMPVQFQGIMQEHHAVRESAGVFDISHMGQLEVKGLDWLNRLLTNDLSQLEIGQGHYTFMLNEEAGVIDDLIAYRSGENSIYMVVNAAKTEEVLSWMTSKLDSNAMFRHLEECGGFAVQGPKAVEVHARAFADLPALPDRNGMVTSQGLTFCRTGYTGEDGFEFFCHRDQIEEWYGKVVESGATPCGLGARDTLRLEMSYPLNGSDLTPNHTPLEAGLGFFVSLDKSDFIGRHVLARQKAEGLQRKLVPIRMTSKSPPPRSHYGVFNGEEQIGELSSGGLSPSQGVGIGMAYLPIQFAKAGTALEIDMRGKRFPAEVAKRLKKPPRRDTVSA